MAEQNRLPVWWRHATRRPLRGAGGYPDSAVCLREGPHRIHRDQASCISLFLLHLLSWSARRSLHWHYVVSIKLEFTVKSNHLHYCTRSEEGKQRWGVCRLWPPSFGCGASGELAEHFAGHNAVYHLPWVRRGCGGILEKCHGAVDLWPPSSGNLLGM